jgi:2-polyprenyl-3-methyl-5-hydroxy-6-metoxy-1,4-benzoquinol methylase
MNPIKKKSGDLTPIAGDYQALAIKSQNPVQRFWHQTKLWTIESLLPPCSSDFALDVGCGSGVVSQFLSESGSQVLGIDGNIQAIDFARKHYTNPKLNFQHGLVDEFFHLEKKADKIYCLEVIEHIYESQCRDMLTIFKKVLKPDGAIFLTTPNYRSLWPFIEWTMDSFKLAPQLDGHQHVTFFNARKLRTLFEECGFQIKTLRSCSFLAPWLAPISWNLAKNLHKYELGSEKLVGSILVCVATH